MTSNDIAVLANPTAGRGRHRDLLPQVMQRLGRSARLLEAHTGEQAEQACHRAVAEGVAALVAVGGDGTVHRALQAVAGRPVSFGVIPAGTGNDFAAGTGIPQSPLAAADAVVAALHDGRTTAVDLAHTVRAVRPDLPPHTAGAVRSDLPPHKAGAVLPDLADTVGVVGPDLAHTDRAVLPDLAHTVGADGAGSAERWFGAVLAAGFDAIVNERANRMRRPRGPRRYDLAILLELARVRPRVYALELDGVDQAFEGTLVAVGNCATYGGGLRILPDADPTDGLLDVVIAEPLGRASLIKLKPRLRQGTHVTDPRVQTFRAKRVYLHTDSIIAYADGERLGPLPLEITCVPGAVRLLR